MVIHNVLQAGLQGMAVVYNETTAASHFNEPPPGKRNFPPKGAVRSLFTDYGSICIYLTAFLLPMVSTVRFCNESPTPACNGDWDGLIFFSNASSVRHRAHDLLRLSTLQKWGRGVRVSK